MGLILEQFSYLILWHANHPELRHSSKTVYLEFVINQILGKEAGCGRLGLWLLGASLGGCLGVRSLVSLVSYWDQCENCLAAVTMI